MATVRNMATVPRTTKVKIPTPSTGSGQALSRKARQGWGSHASVPASEPGRFGVYGGRYVPETLMAALDELEREYEKAKKDKKFQARLAELLRTYAGRPTPLFFARRLTEKLGGAKIYLKREDLLHTGAHKTCAPRYAADLRASNKSSPHQVSRSAVVQKTTG